MQDTPDAAALLEMVEELLRRDLIPALDGALAYQARIAANLIAVAQREWRIGPVDLETEVGRLQALLISRLEDPKALNALLAERIRRGELTLETSGLAEHLWKTTLSKLSVDQPSYPRYRDMLERRASA